MADPEYTGYEFSFAVGSKGDGEGQFNTPMGVAIASDGNFVVVDTGNDRVQVFDRSGKFLTKFGSRFSTMFGEHEGSEGKFFFPIGVALSPSGEIVVADALNHRVQVFDSQGKFLRTFGNKGRGTGNLNGPHGVTITTSDKIAVVDNQNARIQIFSSAGKYLDQFGNEGTDDGQFFAGGMWDVASTSSGDLVVSGLSKVRVYDNSGTFRRKLGETPESSYPTGVAVTPWDHVVVVYMGKFSGIRVFNLEGKQLMEFGSKGEGDGQFNEPAGVAVDRSGTLDVADKANHRIQVFRPVKK